jgi:hypothetical protein
MTKRTSTSYVTTLDVNSACDMEELVLIKNLVKAINNRNPATKQRVVLRGRKPEVKMEIKRNFWTGETRKGPVSYDWAGNIVGGIKNATKIDVYVYDRRS